MNPDCSNQLVNRLTSVVDIKVHLGLTSEFCSDIVPVVEEYPVMVTPYYLSLISKKCPEADPLYRQVIPSTLELDFNDAVDDPLNEEEQMVVPRLIHRYKDRVVLLTTNRCPLYCRFCFRKRKWKRGAVGEDISNEELKVVVEYLSMNPCVREVLISGGDPLMLEDDRLDYILKELTDLPSIDIIRLGSRMVVTLPSRVDDDLIAILKKYKTIWFMSHFNHPNEITKESTVACEKIIDAGIPILNQTVLLAEVNDSAKILEELFRSLIKIRVKPHYLFHVDPVKGVCHFSTGIEKGLSILRQFKKELSSIAVPTFAIDLPKGGGKVALQADYQCGNGFLSIDDEYINY